MGTPGDRFMTEPGGTPSAQRNRSPSHGLGGKGRGAYAPAAAIGREQKRRGCTSPPSDGWMAAIGFAGGGICSKDPRQARSGREERVIARVWEVFERVIAWIRID